MLGRLKEFGRCAKAGFADDQPDSDAALELCMERDPSGRVARACDAAAGRIASRALPRSCVRQGVDLSDAFPGCASDDAGVTAACLARSSACRVCLGLNEAGELGADCDRIDDGVANASCP